MNSEKIIFSINIEDVQNIAEDELGRKLTQQELKVIESKIRDYFDWYDLISLTISVNLES